MPIVFGMDELLQFLGMRYEQEMPMEDVMDIMGLSVDLAPELERQLARALMGYQAPSVGDGR